MMAPVIERICENLQLAEGPHWDAETQSLYYVDIYGKSIHKYKPSTNENTKAYIGKHVSFIIPVEGSSDRFLISIERTLAVITWDGISSEISETETIVEVDSTPLVPTRNFNDGKTDSTGKLWAGTLNSEVMTGDDNVEKGTLYSLGVNKQVKSHVSGLRLSNGLAWSADLRKFYFIDTAEGRVDQFDFDVQNESIANRQPLFTLNKHNLKGLPDGQTIDANENLWVAVFGENKVIKIDSRKPETLLDTIELPAKQVTSVAFGGANLDELYVTTGRISISGEAIPPAPENGALYKVTGLGVKGLPGVRVKL